MYENPQDYLVGPTYNVTGVIQACRYPYGNSTLVCETEPPAVRDSYLWYVEATYPGGAVSNKVSVFQSYQVE